VRIVQAVARGTAQSDRNSAEFRPPFAALKLRPAARLVRGSEAGGGAQCRINWQWRAPGKSNAFGAASGAALELCGSGQFHRGGNVAEAG